jgi:hypothetical protein
VVSELTAERATVVVHQDGKWNIQEIAPRQDNQVQTSRRLVVSEEFSHPTLRSVAPDGATQTTWHDNTQASVLQSVRPGHQRHISAPDPRATPLDP